MIMTRPFLIVQRGQDTLFFPFYNKKKIKTKQKKMVATIYAYCFECLPPEAIKPQSKRSEKLN